MRMKKIKEYSKLKETYTRKYEQIIFTSEMLHKAVLWMTSFFCHNFVFTVKINRARVA